MRVVLVLLLVGLETRHFFFFCLSLAYREIGEGRARTVISVRC